MIRLETTKATGAQNSPARRRNGRGASGFCRRSAPRANGAPAYMSTVAEVMKPTRLCQPGKGRKRISPMTKAKIRPTHGTWVFLVVFSKASGMAPFLERPKVSRLDVVV